jgi:hypothetical protein
MYIHVNEGAHCLWDMTWSHVTRWRRSRWGLAWWTNCKCHYYRLIYYRLFHCRRDRSNDVILAPSVGTIARPPRTETDSLDFYHRQVNNRCGSGIGVAFPPSHEKLGWLGYSFCPPALKCIWSTDSKFSVSVQLPQFPRLSNHHYFRCLKPKSRVPTALHILQA